MAYTERKKIIEEIESKRGSKVITLITGDRVGATAAIASDSIDYIYDNLRNFNSDERRKIDLFLYSRGGEFNTPWAIVSMLRQMVKGGNLGVLIPYKAHSAATVIAIGADEIVMGEKGELGAIDATLQKGPYNPTELNSNQRLPLTVEDVTGFFSLLKEVGCKTSKQKLEGFEILASKVHPLALGQVNRQLEHTKQVAKKLLKNRNIPLRDKKNNKIIEMLATKTYSHSHVISRKEARDDIGLEFVKDAEEFDIHELMWSLYKDYENELELLEPFKPEDYLIQNPGTFEHIFKDIKIAFSESTYVSYCYMSDRRVKRLKSVPPQVNLTLGNIALPQLPQLPPGLQPQQIQQLIQQWLTTAIPQILQQAADNAVKSFINALPDTGYQHQNLNDKWRKS